MSEFKVPELGENIEEGDVTRVLVKVGDSIVVEQPVLELETDKATIEVPSSVTGVVQDIRVTAGQKIKVGAVILTVSDAPSAAVTTPPAGAEAATPPTVAGAPSPTAAAAARPEQGTVATASEATGGSNVVSMPRPAAESGTAQSSRGVLAPAAPSVRRLAREIGVGIGDVPGSGPGGRISQDDVKGYAKALLSAQPVRASAGGSRRALPLPDFTRWGEVDRQSMNNIRRKTAEHLSHAWTVIPHVTQFDKADITAMEDLRRRYRNEVAEAGGNLTVTAMLVKVLATAVQQFPQFNASLDPDAQEIVFKKYVNVGVAADTDRGLLVPVIHNADQKNILEISVELNQAAEKARSRKLTIEEMSGGGITVTNLGGLGGTYFTPIVNWPEVAILGVSRGIIEPVWRDETFAPRRLLPLALSYDHRVIDGADAIRFLRWVVEAIEQPFLLSLHG